MPGLGFAMYCKNVLLNTSFQLPGYATKTDHPASTGRLELFVSYSLNRTRAVPGLVYTFRFIFPAHKRILRTCVSG